MSLRNNGPSEHRTFATTDLRNNGTSEKRAVPEKTSGKMKGEQKEQITHLDIHFVNYTVTRKDGLALEAGSYRRVRPGQYKHIPAAIDHLHTNLTR